MYSEAEQIYTDYRDLLHSIQRMFEKGEELGVIVRFLEDGRMKNHALRDKIRAVIRRYPLDDTEITAFERGIMGLLSGGIQPYDPGPFYLHPYSNGIDRAFGHKGGEHTLLDLLRRFSQPEGPSREKCLNDVKRQVETLDRAWHDVVKGFAHYESTAHPKPRVRR